MIVKNLRRVYIITVISSVIFSLHSCAFSSGKTRKYLKEASSQKFDIVIVPGVPFEDGKWSRTMKARVYWSKYLFDRGIAKNIMYSGSSVYSPYYEAEIMALYGEAIGIPRQNIFTETRAEHSTENIYYSFKKAKLSGFNMIAFASDPFQTKLLKRFTRERVSPEVQLIPIVFDTLKMLEPSMIDPEIDYDQALNKSFISITTRENFWKRWKGTRGGNLDSSAYNK